MLSISHCLLFSAELIPALCAFVSRVIANRTRGTPTSYGIIFDSIDECAYIRLIKNTVLFKSFTILLAYVCVVTLKIFKFSIDI